MPPRSQTPTILAEVASFFRAFGRAAAMSPFETIALRKCHQRHRAIGRPPTTNETGRAIISLGCFLFPRVLLQTTPTAEILAR